MNVLNHTLSYFKLGMKIMYLTNKSKVNWLLWMLQTEGHDISFDGSSLQSVHLFVTSNNSLKTAPSWCLVCNLMVEMVRWCESFGCDSCGELSKCKRVSVTVLLCLTDVSSCQFWNILLWKESPFMRHSLVIFKIVSAVISGCL